MKSIRKIAAVILCIAAVFALTASSAGAAGAALSTTKAAVKAFDDEGWKYSVDGMTDDGDAEVVYISFTGDNMDSIDLTLLFSKKTERVIIYSFDIIEYKASDFSKVMRLCNQMNYDYYYVRFYCDETDNTVIAEFDSFTPVASAGEITVDMVNAMSQIIDEVYPEFEDYDIG